MCPFDTINHKILLNKLEKYGFRGRTHSWLESYLDNRYQFVQFNDHQSEMRRVTCGVPQGSLIGLKLFILYINDLCKASDLLNCVLFADDTTLYLSGDNIQQLITEVTRELSKMKKWFDQNKLSFNISKTKYIIQDRGTGGVRVQAGTGRSGSCMNSRMHEQITLMFPNALWKIHSSSRPHSSPSI